MAFNNISENISLFGASINNTVYLNLNTNSSSGNYNSQTGLYGNSCNAKIGFRVSGLVPSNILLNSNCSNTFSGMSSASFNLSNLSKRFNCDEIRDASYMFAYDSYISGNAFIPPIATNISGMYFGCGRLSGLQGSENTYSSVKDASFFMQACENMYMNFPKLTRVENLSNAFVGLRRLYNVGKLPDTANNLSYAFAYTNFTAVDNNFGQVIMGNNVRDAYQTFLNSINIWGVTSSPNLHSMTETYFAAKLYCFDWNNFYTTNLWFLTSTFQNAIFPGDPLGNNRRYISLDLSKATGLQSAVDTFNNTYFANNVRFTTVWFNSAILASLNGFLRTVNLNSAVQLVLQRCTNAVFLNRIFSSSTVGTSQSAPDNRTIIVGNMDTFNHFANNMGSIIGFSNNMLNNLVWTNVTHYTNVNFYRTNGTLASSINLRLTKSVYNNTYKLYIAYAPDLDTMTISSNMGVK